MLADPVPDTPAPDRSVPRAERSRRRRVLLGRARLALGLAALVGAVAVGVAPLAAPGADAADWGPGFSDADNGGLGWLGAFRVDGVTVYCLEGGAPFALGATSGPSYGGWAGLSADDLARLHWAISHGQTDSPVIAAAVALYVWSVADPAHFGSHGMAGEDWYLPRVPSEHRDAVRAELAAIRAATAEATATAATPSGAMRLDIDPVDATLGTLRVTELAPASATGTVTLVGAVAADTGEAVLTGVGLGAAIPIVGLPPADGSPYRVAAVGEFTAPAGNAGELGIYETPGQQALAGPGRESSAALRLEAADEQDRTSTFRPVVVTEVPAVGVRAGERFQDVLRFGLAADENGRENRWYRDPDGVPATVTASCRVFGPFAAPPVPSAEPPADAPVATTFTVTTSPDGPEAPYAAVSEQPLHEPGYYTAACSIDAGSQLAATRAFLPPDYRFQDGFGLVAETSVVPFRPALSTRLVPEVVGLGAEVVDEVTVGASGRWLADADGEPAAVELVGVFTFVTEEPVRAAEAPEGAAVIAERRVVVTGPGTVAADPVPVPRRAGWVVAQWCALDGGLVVGVCDDWAAPGEVARVALPTVTTRADAEARPGGTVRDVAIVEGPVPAGGLLVEFRGYLQPPGAVGPVCAAETLVFESSTPTLATGPGEWASEAFAVRPEHLGTVYWVETARDVEGAVIAEGSCGLPSETTRIAIARALAATGAGSPGAGPGVVAAGLLAVPGLLLVLASARRRRS